ncbi:hypothetical protein K458DRAFT_88720 [Lentithecium fluviatile CBS 122367]|uniref:DUF4267 domain-containing protein n=1 Tax=Lentithecium fluviatile CBS 122367 TaxID=1168545 RepID=A0A6G1ISD7_9PLEO|nr:hypothetical protein K458DRAFT_88720 [Lentithecium fluviatile CBS 122367]
MAFPNRLFVPPTWRLLGLGLATTILGLGAGAIIMPLTVARGLGVIPTTSEGRAVTERNMIFLGARDLSIGATLLWLYYERKHREMGMLATSGVIFYVADILVAAKGPRGWDAGVWGLTGAAAVATFIGLGLLQS